MQKILIFLLLFSVLSISDLLILLRQAFYHGTHLLHYAARAYHLYVPVKRHDPAEKMAADRDRHGGLEVVLVYRHYNYVPVLRHLIIAHD